MSDSRSENAQKAAPQEVELIIPMLQDMELTATQTACSIAQHMKFDEDRIDEVFEDLDKKNKLRELREVGCPGQGFA